MFRRNYVPDIPEGSNYNFRISNGERGFFFQDRNLARLDSMLQVTGEAVVLLRRKWTGKRCKCIGLRREHARTRCDRCFGTGFDGGYNRFINTRAISERFVNTQGLILIRIHPFSDDLKIEDGQGLTQPSEPAAAQAAAVQRAIRNNQGGHRRLIADLPRKTGWNRGFLPGMPRMFAQFQTTIDPRREFNDRV